MPKIRTLSAKKIIKILGKYGFFIESQKGSHIKLKRTFLNKKEILIIPNHKTLHKGTIHAIYNQVKVFIPNKEINSDFFTE